MPDVVTYPNSEIVQMGRERLYGPSRSTDGRTELLYGPGDELTRAEAEQIGLVGDGPLADGYWLEQLDPPTEQEMSAQRDTLAAQRLYDIEHSQDPDKIAREAHGLAKTGEHLRKDSAGVRQAAPTDADLAYARRAQEVERKMLEQDADSPAELDGVRAARKQAEAEARLAAASAAADAEEDAQAGVSPGNPDDDGAEGDDDGEGDGAEEPATREKETPARTSEKPARPRTAKRS